MNVGAIDHEYLTLFETKHFRLTKHSKQQYPWGCTKRKNKMLKIVQYLYLSHQLILTVPANINKTEAKIEDNKTTIVQQYKRELCEEYNKNIVIFIVSQHAFLYFLLIFSFLIFSFPFFIFFFFFFY